MQVQLCGGKVSTKVEEDCTHIILEDRQNKMDCADILEMIKTAGGIESLENFRNLLKAKLSIVQSRSASVLGTDHAVRRLMYSNTK